VVEDDRALARALARLLRSYGHDVYVAATCAEARSAPGRFSLGVFDIDLPDGNGVDLAQERSAAGAVKRVVFFTGSVEATERARASGLGPCITKGRGVAVLRIAIENALNEVSHQVVGSDEQVIRPTSTAPPPSTIKRRGDR
jgi:DNA-binding response OmpR family regulator